MRTKYTIIIQSHYFSIIFLFLSFCFTSIFPLAIISCKGNSASSGVGAMRNYELAVWGENLEYKNYENIYPRLKELQVELFLAIKEGDFPPPDFIDKVDFRAWLLLSREKGYWLSVWNAKEFFELVESFVLNYKNKVQWIILDIEIPIQFTESLTQNFLSSISMITPPESIYEEGKKYISEIVDFIKRNGMKVMCVTVPFVLDDLEDGDDDIQRFLGIYLPSGCDEYSFMVYTTIITNFVKGEIDNPEYFVWIYGELGTKFFGEKVGLDVGLVGSDSFGNTGYISPDELKKDISAGLSSGVRKFHIWTVDNMVIKPQNRGTNVSKGVLEPDTNLDEKWIPGYVEPVKPQKSEKVELLRQIFLLLDR